MVLVASAGAASAQRGEGTHALIVCASRFWHNYRHAANALSIYAQVRRLGLPDSRIILMLADNWACNARNVFPGTVFGSSQRSLNLYLDDIQVDYRGEEVNVHNFLLVLTDQHPSGVVPASRRLRPNTQSNVLVYLTGHGGNGFLKFADREELTAGQLAAAVAIMRFQHLLLAVDTCQAASLPAALATPGALAMASSLVGEDSYSHHNDGEIGVPVIDRFTFHLSHFLEALTPRSNATLQDLADFMRRQPLASTFHLRTDLLPERLDHLRVTAFFGEGGQRGAGPQPPEDSPAACGAAAGCGSCCQAGSNGGGAGDRGAWAALHSASAACSNGFMRAEDLDAFDSGCGLEGMVLGQDAVPWPAEMQIEGGDSIALACSAALAVSAVLACLLTLLGTGQVHRRAVAA